MKHGEARASVSVVRVSGEQARRSVSRGGLRYGVVRCGLQLC